MSSSIRIIEYENDNINDCFEVHENIINFIKSNLPE